MSDLAIAGTVAGQPVSDAASLSPFSGVTVVSSASATPEVTAVATLSAAADGALSHLGVGTLSADGSTYTVSGSPALVQAALRALVFTPTLHQVPVGQSVATGFGLTVSDASGSTTSNGTSVVATAADTAPTITDTSAQQAPTPSILNTSTSSPTDPGLTSFTPFAYTTIADPDVGARETTTITVSQNNAATDAVGVLSGAGLTKTGVGTYVLAAASPAAETSELQALRFTPTNPTASAATGVSLDVALGVSDGFAPSTTYATTLALARNPGGSTVYSASGETVTTYSDTAAAQTTHTYATTVEGVLNGSTVVYEQSFDLPYGDPQIQAAVAQAQAAVRSAGGTPDAAQQTASNLSTVSSQTSSQETGRTTNVHSFSQTDFGPDFIGPNVGVGGYTSNGYLYVFAGQLDINTDIETDDTVSRTVTTTSTDLLSQKYVVSGSTMASTPSTEVSRISVSQSGAQSPTNSGDAYATEYVASLSADGTHELFYGQPSLANNTSIRGNVDPLLIKDLSSGAVTEVALTPQGAEGVTNGSNSNPNNFGSLSGDASVLAFSSGATNLNSGATDGNYHVFLETLATGAISLVSPSDYSLTLNRSGAPESSSVFTGFDMFGFNGGTVSYTGRYLTVYGREAGSDVPRVLLLDTQSHTGVDIALGAYPQISADGSRVAYVGGLSSDLSSSTAYVYDHATNTSTAVSTTATGTANNGRVNAVAISGNGAEVAFTTTATNLSPADTDSTADLYVKNLATGALTLVDVNAAGVKGDGVVGGFSLSADGSIVVFDSGADNLIAGVSGGTHVYQKNLLTGALTLLDVTPSGAPGDGSSGAPSISADGGRTTFESTSDNLVAGDTNQAVDLFVSPALAATAPPANTPPTITGLPAAENDPGQATFMPFTTAMASDPDAGQTFTVILQSNAVAAGGAVQPSAAGSFSGGGFSSIPNGAPGSVSFSSTSIAAVQAALQAVSFTPGGAFPGSELSVSISDGTAQNTYNVLVTSTPASPANTPPAVGGTVANQPTTDKSTVHPFSTVTVTDPDAGQTETVTVTYAAANGTLAGGGLAGQAGSYSAIFASAAAAQAGLQALVFTPTPNEVTPGQSVTTGFTVAVSDGLATGSNSGASVVAASVNDPPVLGGVPASQTATAGATATPFAAATIADPDTGQTETVTVSFAPGAGAFAGVGFTGSGGVYSGTFASASASQAALRAATFTPAVGASASDVLTVSVQDAPGGGAPAAASTTLAVSYTPPTTGGGGSVTITTPTSPSVQYGLLTEFQNLERALATGADAQAPGTPIYAAFQAEKAIAAQLDAGSITLTQADAALDHLVDGTTAVAVSTYAFFTGYTPTALGLDYLVHSPANPNDLNDPYYAKFSTENREINFAVNLATGAGAGAAAFQATYGSLSLADATAKAYLAVFGTTPDAAKVFAILNTLVPDGLGGQETRAAYFAQSGGDGPNGQGTKAAMVGFLLAQAVQSGSGIYGAATEHYLDALAHGTAPAMGSELALHYGAAVSLVGVTPIPDTAVTG